MKKLLALCLTVVLCLCCLASCGSAHEENKWFSEEKLTNCLVGDLPTIEKDYVNHNDEDIYVSFTDSEFEAYAKSVYDYLLSQEYKYLGTRGEQKDTLAGVFTTYYFEPATELESFWNEGDYIFVFSDGSTDENGDVEFIVLIIYEVSTNTLEYGNKKFTYNTQISLRRGSEAHLSGFYVLKEYSINYETSKRLMDGYAPTKASPGDTVVLRTGPIMDADLDFYANGVKCKQTHADSDYWEYVFTMPDEDVVITSDISGGGPVLKKSPLRDLTGCEWLNEIAPEDIAKIKIISGAVGVAPGNLNNASSSTDEAVIARIFEEYYQLDTRPISKMEGQIDGGGGVTVKFVLKNGTVKELYINNGNYLDTNGDYFELLSTPKFKDTDNKAKAYGFITYIGTGAVYLGDFGTIPEQEPEPICIIDGIGEMEFISIDRKPDQLPELPQYCVETEFGTLQIFGPFNFAFNGTHYLRVDGGNLLDMIEDAK